MVYPSRIFSKKKSVKEPMPDPVSTSNAGIAADTSLWLSRTDFGHMMTYTADKVIGEAIRQSGRFEETDIEQARGIIEGLGVSVELSTFLDVGANIGTHSLFSLRCGFRRAVCIEADPRNFKLLRANQILNDVDQDCVNILAAASSKAGESTFELSPTNFGDHRVRLETARQHLHDEGSWQLITVSTKPLDTILSDVSVNYRDIGLVWIDTQGHEGHVLSGAGELLRTGVPIVAEFWPYGLERSGGYKLLRDAISNSGRRMFDLRQCIVSGNPKQIDLEIELDEIYQSMLENESNKNRQPKTEPTHTDMVII